MVGKREWTISKREPQTDTLPRYEKLRRTYNHYGRGSCVGGQCTAIAALSVAGIIVPPHLET